jgi:epoxyqueuosine reductase
MVKADMSIVAELSKRIKDEGFEHFGFTSLKLPLSLGIYRQWLKDGCHGDMTYLEEHLPMKEMPQLLMPKVRSAIVVTEPYFPLISPPQPLGSLRTALYAQAPDYHHSLKTKLEAMAASLADFFPCEEFLCYVDSKPVPERELAVRAGLGWVGKNGCVISPKRGSLFFLAEIYTTLDIQAENSPMPDHCGTCDRCIRACPTAAIRDNRTLDARLCISYWTIEAKDKPPTPLRSKMQDWFFGCDICQTVCPWNEKVFGKDEMRSLSAIKTSSAKDAEEDLRWCLSASNREIEQRLGNLPLLRARGRGLKRNALIVIANLKITALAPDVEQVAEKFPLLRELALWTLEQLKGP